MAINTVPSTFEAVVQLLKDAADGARDHAAEADLKHNSEAGIRAALEAIVGRTAGPGGNPPAIPGAKAAWNQAKSDKTAKSAALQGKMKEGRTLAAACVSVLKLRLGTQWNSAWNAAGFTNGSLAIPLNPMSLLQQLRAYYLAHPEHEASNLTPTLSATAAACEAAAQTISVADTEANQSAAAADLAGRNLKTALAAGKSRLTSLRAELAQTLPKDSHLWPAFGFQRPSDPEVAPTPGGVVATPGAPGSGVLMVRWGNARRAESYRAIVRTDAKPPVQLAARLVHENETTFTGLPAGAVQVTVTAINAAGESRESEPAAASLA